MIHLAILGNIFPPVCLMARSVLSNWTEKFPLGAKPQHGNHIIGRRGFGSLNFFILKNRNLKFLWVGKSSGKPGNCIGHLFFFFFSQPVFGKKESATTSARTKASQSLQWSEIHWDVLCCTAAAVNTAPPGGRPHHSKREQVPCMFGFFLFLF